MNRITKINLKCAIGIGVLAFLMLSTWGCDKFTTPVESRTIAQEEVAAAEGEAEAVVIVVLGGECHLDLIGQAQCSDFSVVTVDGFPAVGTVLWQAYIGAVIVQQLPVSSTNAGVVTFRGLAPGPYSIKQTVSFGGTIKVADYSVTVAP